MIPQEPLGLPVTRVCRCRLRDCSQSLSSIENYSDTSATHKVASEASRLGGVPALLDTSCRALEPSGRHTTRRLPRSNAIEASNCAQTGATSLHQIADTLNARGISTPRGGQWYAKSVSNVLARA